VPAEEAERIARDMLRGKPSKPGRRVGGNVIASDGSELRGAPVPGGGYVLYVRSRMRSGEWGRTRGVEVLEVEKPVVAGLLKQLAGNRAGA
jgi:hypothetical protein